ncbi:hypothetical protein GCM10010428_57420 [Actinosynnema pretiosum subsp. pretiosum]
MFDVDLEHLLDGHDVPWLRARVERALERHDLRVHLVVLCHGEETARFTAATRLCRAVGNALCGERVQLAVSYQGGPVPAELTPLLKIGVAVYAQHPRLAARDATAPSREGKTEHVLALLAALRAEPGDPRRRFVVVLDGDYVVYDPVDALALYAPWALGFTSENGGGPELEHYAGVGFAKGGGLRLAVEPGLLKHDTDRTWGFLDLLDAAQARSSPRAPRPSSTLPAEFVPTAQGLRRVLAPAARTELEKAVQHCTRPGGRSSRGLTQYLASRTDHPLALELTRFSFLLHGDQGATLDAWSRMSLAPGYGLELSFLVQALRDHAAGRVVNAITLPHSHLPKAEPDNWALGVRMFSLLHRLLTEQNACGLVEPITAALRHAAPGPLGYRFTDLDAHHLNTPLPYPPLVDLEVTRS